MDMNSTGARALTIAGALTFITAAAQLACNVTGASAYRFMGAGARMARAVDAGKLLPALVSLGISAVLTTRAACAFSAAGVIGEVPSAKLVCPAISAVFLARAFGLPLLKSGFGLQSFGKPAMAR